MSGPFQDDLRVCEARWSGALTGDVFGKPSVMVTPPRIIPRGRPYRGRVPHFYVSHKIAFTIRMPRVSWKSAADEDIQVATAPPPPVPLFAINLEHAFKVVAELFAVKVTDLLSVRRAQCYAKPRFALFLLLKELTPLSLPRIGRIVKRDHTSVMHGLRRARDLIERDPEFRANFEKARAVLEWKGA